jgi:TonB family protein
MKNEKHPCQLNGFSAILIIPTLALILLISLPGKAINPARDGALSASLTAVIDTPLVQVSEMPEFPGGDMAILKYIAQNTVYPEEAKKNKITGKVIVRFIVEKDCTISDVTVLQSVNPQLDAEAVRVIKTLPKFEKPAKNEGKVVRVYYMIPITFALK